MPEDTRLNAMQANIGLGAGGSATTNIMTPAQAAITLTEQASMRQVQSQQIMRGNTLGMPSVATFSSQYAQELQRIQSQQSMSMYTAQAMASMSPSSMQYQPNMLPSPLMMTPPSTGVFRPPMGMMGQAPVMPMTLPQPQISPFTPRVPPPMFTSSYDQMLRMQDVQANQGFAYTSQIPGMLGSAGAIAGGAYMGSRIGGAFGGAGRLIGAGAGALLTGASGFAEGVGNLMQLPMQPAIQRREMGAALQRSSQNWVVSGSQLHGIGQGLSRDASIQLAQGIQDISSDRSFQSQTGNMFNSQDLMQITQRAGSAGLMDMAQSVPQIKSKLRETAQTIKQFMEITNDPDVNNVIRQMGQMRQMGMTQQDMVQAAQGMKTYARMAGTTVGGIQQMGGLPGAATFQGAGMTAATGFNYGNFAAASARQLVASGGISPRELALMGGVSGITQREIQGQAALAGMPLFGAAHAQFSGGQWGLNQNIVGSSQGGAAGMVLNAVSAANQGVRAGGLGALAMLPIQQREVSDLAMRNMTPEQAMAQRFSMVNATQQMLGLQGTAGFGAAAQMMFGPEVGEQMWRQAKNPQFWAAQRKQLSRRRTTLALKQAQQREAQRGTLEKIGDAFGVGDSIRDIGEDLSGIGGIDTDVGGAIKRAAGRGWNAVTESWDDFMLDDSVVRRRIPKSAAIDSERERAALIRNSQSGLNWGDYSRESVKDAGIGIDRFDNLGRALNYRDKGLSGTMATMVGGGNSGYFSVGAGEFASEAGQGVLNYLIEGGEESRNIMRSADIERSRTLKMIRGAKNITDKDEDKLYAALSKAGAKDVGQKMSTLGRDIAEKWKKSGRTSAWSSLTSGEDWTRRLKALGKGDFGGFATMSSSKDLKESDVRQEVIKAYGKDVWDKMSKSEKELAVQSTMSSIMAEGGSIAEYARSAEAEASGELADSAEEAAKISAESYEDDMETLGEKVGLESWTGMYKKGVEGEGGFLEQLQGNTTNDLLLMAAASGDKKAYNKAKEMWTKAGNKGGDAAFRKAVKGAKKKLGGLSSDTRDRFRDASKNLDALVGMSETQKTQTKSEALRSFAGELGEYADSTKLTDVLRKTGTIDMQEVANAMSEEGITKMYNSGDKKRAMLLKGARQGDKKSIAALEQMALEDAELGTKKDEAAVSAEGEEAQKLKESEDAMKNLSAIFADMRPAIKDFRAASRDFKDAMDADSFIRSTE